MQRSELIRRTSILVLLGTSLSAGPAFATGSLGGSVSVDVSVGSSGASASADVGIGEGRGSATGSADISVGGDKSHGSSGSHGAQTGVSGSVDISGGAHGGSKSGAGSGTVGVSTGTQGSSGATAGRSMTIVASPQADASASSSPVPKIKVSAALVGLPVFSSDNIYIGQVTQVKAGGILRISTTEEGTLELDNAIAQVGGSRVILRVAANVLAPWLDDDLAKLSLR